MKTEEQINKIIQGLEFEHNRPEFNYYPEWRKQDILSRLQTLKWVLS